MGRIKHTLRDRQTTGRAGTCTIEACSCEEGARGHACLSERVRQPETELKAHRFGSV